MSASINRYRTEYPDKTGKINEDSICKLKIESPNETYKKGEIVMILSIDDDGIMTSAGFIEEKDLQRVECMAINTDKYEDQTPIPTKYEYWMESGVIFELTRKTENSLRIAQCPYCYK